MLYNNNTLNNYNSICNANVAIFSAVFFLLFSIELRDGKYHFQFDSILFRNIENLLKIVCYNSDRYTNGNKYRILFCSQTSVIRIINLKMSAFQFCSDLFNRQILSEGLCNKNTLTYTDSMILTNFVGETKKPLTFLTDIHRLN